jgi:hypothetical protein
MTLIRKLLPFGALVFLSGIAAVMVLSQKATAMPPAVTTLPSATILYLAPTSLAAADDIPGSSAAFQTEGVTVIHDFNSLKRAMEQSKVDAIILHQLSLPGVEKSWVVSQYRNGVVIAAINVKMRDLADLVSDPSIVESPWTDNWYKKPFYSYVGIKITLFPSGEPSRQTVAQGTNNINDQEGNLKRFLYALNLAVKAFRTQP